MTLNVLKWVDINYIIGDKYVLNHLYGSIRISNLTAVLGPSGSGKTSLLNVLSGRVPVTRGTRLFGEFLYNNQRLDDCVPGRHPLVAYVLQDDAIFPQLTVLESLLLSTHFRLPSTTLAEKLSVVNQLLSNLGLLSIKNSVVGGITRRGISGGEKKRLAIGMELIGAPEIVLLDEPTSGLDSYQAHSVVHSIKAIARKHKMVLATFHQPRSSIFDMFDNLIILSGGKTMYCGDAQTIHSYFFRIGYICPQHHNPADFFLDIVSVDSSSTQAHEESLKRISTIAQAWSEWESRASSTDSADETSARDILNRIYQGESFEDHSDRYVTSQIILQSIHCWWLQLRIQSWRSFVSKYRDGFGMGLRFGTTLFSILVISLVYHSLGYQQRNIQDRIGIMFLLVVQQAFGNAVATLNSFTEDIHIVRRERLLQGYSLSAFFLGRVLSELIVVFALTMLLCSVVYWACNLNPDWERFLVFVGIVELESISAAGIGFAVSAVATSHTVASALLPPVLVIFILFSGFYINMQSLPPGSQWVAYISFMKWAFQALVVNELQGTVFHGCPPSQRTSIDPSRDCTTAGEQVLASLDFQKNTAIWSVIPLLCLSLGYYTIAMMCLWSNREHFLKLTRWASNSSQPPEFASGNSLDHPMQESKEGRTLV